MASLERRREITRRDVYDYVSSYTTDKPMVLRRLTGVGARAFPQHEVSSCITNQGHEGI